MKSLNIALAAGAVLALSAPTIMTSTAYAYQCSNNTVQVKIHRPRMAPARIQARKSWSLKVKSDLGLAWSVWKIAKKRSMKCKKSGQRWVCTAKAKPCLYVVQ